MDVGQRPATCRPTAVVITGGDPPDAAVVGRLPSPAYVIAADSGLDHAAALGLPVDHAVGDFDSVSPAARAAAEAAGIPVEVHPAAKDATDLELALDTAVRTGAARIVVVGGSGGRLDHLLATAFLLAAPAYARLDVSAFLGAATVHVVRRSLTMTGRPGELLTLLPLHGIATGVTTVGLRYPLAGEDLRPGSTRGVSNEFTETRADVRLTGGVLIAVRPGDAGTAPEETP
jgi:thiamine pyrophosphokinase